jgi:hypothetical protein
VRPLTSAMRNAMVGIVRDAPLSQGKVEFAWNAVVGPAVQRATRVRLEKDTLIIEATNAQWAREVSRSASIILPRLQDYLGRSIVVGLSVRVA